MKSIDTATYDAFKEAGVSEETARAAAASVSELPDKSGLVTNDQLDKKLSELETRLTLRMIMLMMGVGSLFTAIILSAVNYMMKAYLG